MLAEINKPTVPFALPLWPDAIAIQLWFDEAVQLQPANVDTSNDKRPPAAAIESLARFKEYRHGAAA